MSSYETWFKQFLLQLVFQWMLMVTIFLSFYVGLYVSRNVLAVCHVWLSFIKVLLFWTLVTEREIRSKSRLTHCTHLITCNGLGIPALGLWLLAIVPLQSKRYEISSRKKHPYHHSPCQILLTLFVCLSQSSTQLTQTNGCRATCLSNVEM